jgi:hypothetical protein
VYGHTQRRVSKIKFDRAGASISVEKRGLISCSKIFHKCYFAMERSVALDYTPLRKDTYGTRHG